MVGGPATWDNATMDRALMPASGSLAARLSLILAALAAVVVLFLPLGRAVTEGPAGPGEPDRPAEERSTTLLHEEGPGAVALVAFPVLLAAIPGLGERFRPGSRGLRIVAAASLWLFVIAGLASIGWFFAPSAVAMTLAAAGRQPAAPQQR